MMVMAASGISFGTTRDTNLYRSASDTLATSDNFNVALDLDVASQAAIVARQVSLPVEY